MKLYPEERVQKGILLALQNPTPPVPEVRLSTLITAMINKKAGKRITDPPPPQVIAEMTKLTTELGLKLSTYRGVFMQDSAVVSLRGLRCFNS